MDITPYKERQYCEIVLNSLAGMEDDLLASAMPFEAVEHIRQALAICSADFKKRFDC